MEIIAIKEMSAGNETVGEVWQETKIFHESATVLDVIGWSGLKKRVTLSLPENNEKEFNEPPPELPF